MNPESIDYLARLLWNYQLVGHTLKKSDLLLVLGGSDLRVADYAARLWLEGWAPLIVCSGKLGKKTYNFGKTEARLFAETAMSLGVPESRILLEDKSTNTAENIRFTREILAERGINTDSIILVSKPYAERRAYATFQKIWAEKKVVVTSPQISFDHYFTEELSRERVINLLVGTLQRILVYTERGFQVLQEIPDQVLEAYWTLRSCGYIEELIS